MTAGKPCLNLTHDAFETYGEVFHQWPFVRVHPHPRLGPVLVLGEIAGRNRNGHRVLRTCSLDGESFPKLASLASYDRRDQDTAYRVKLVAVPERVLCKAWTTVDDPARAKGDRDITDLYRYLEVSTDGAREIDRTTYDLRRKHSATEISAVAERLLTECRRPLQRAAEDIFWEIVEELAASYDAGRFSAIRVLARALAILSPTLERAAAPSGSDPSEHDGLRRPFGELTEVRHG